MEKILRKEYQNSLLLLREMVLYIISAITLLVLWTQRGGLKNELNTIKLPTTNY